MDVTHVVREERDGWMLGIQRSLGWEATDDEIGNDHNYLPMDSG